MKLFLPVVVLGTASLAAISSAQAVKLNSHDPDFGKTVFYASAYDQHSVVRFKAKIKGFSTTPGRHDGEANDFALAVLPFEMGTDNHGKKQYIFATDLVHVELGPEWFVKDQDVKLKVNDYVEITGSRMVMNGQRVIIAQMIRKGVGVLAVRNMSGQPYWYDASNATSLADIESDMRKSEIPPNNWGPQPENQQVWQLGSIQVYGGAFPVTGGSYYNVSHFVPLVPRGGGVVILPGYWYNGPPDVIRY